MSTREVGTFNACSRSSRVWAAEIQRRALASSKGVAGKATETTATCIEIWFLISKGKSKMSTVFIKQFRKI